MAKSVSYETVSDMSSFRAAIVHVGEPRFHERIMGGETLKGTPVGKELPSSEGLMPAPPYSAVIFDCDGTLVDTLPTHYRALNEVLATEDIALDRDWFMARVGLSTRELLVELLSEGAHVFDVEQIALKKERRFGELGDTVVAMEDVVAVARHHRGRVPLAVASGGPSSQVELSLSAAGLDDLFDVVVTYDDVGRGKPAPDLFLTAAERLGVEPENCVVYEDSEEGLQAAAAAGMRSIDVRPFLPA